MISKQEFLDMVGHPSDAPIDEASYALFKGVFGSVREVPFKEVFNYENDLLPRISENLLVASEHSSNAILIHLNRLDLLTSYKTSDIEIALTKLTGDLRNLTRFGAPYRHIFVFSVVDLEDGIHLVYFTPTSREGRGARLQMASRGEGMIDRLFRKEERSTFYDEVILQLQGRAWPGAFYIGAIRKRLVADLPADWKLSAGMLSADLAPDLRIEVMPCWTYTVTICVSVGKKNLQDSTESDVLKHIVMLLEKALIKYGCMLDAKALPACVAAIPSWAQPYLKIGLTKEAASLAKKLAAHKKKGLLLEHQLEAVRSMSTILDGDAS